MTEHEFESGRSTSTALGSEPVSAGFQASKSEFVPRRRAVREHRRGQPAGPQHVVESPGLRRFTSSALLHAPAPPPAPG